MSDGQVLTRVHAADGKLGFERVQDIEPILDLAHDLRAMGRTGSSEFRHAAKLPMVEVEKYCNSRGVSFREFMADPKHAAAMVNDPANALFRVWEGRV